MNLTNQPIDSALVPLQCSHFGKYEPIALYDGDGISRPRAKESNGLHDQWNAIWGAYSFKTEDGRDNVVEAGGMITTYTHDFCGGLTASSLSVNSQSFPLPNEWGRRENRSLSLRSPHRLALYNPENYAALPKLEEAVALVESEFLTTEQAVKILKRSLAFWTVGAMFGSGKSGMVCADKTHGTSREIFGLMQEFERFPIKKIGCRSQDFDPTWLVEQAKNVTMRRPFGCSCAEVPTSYANVEVDFGSEFTNRNSGNKVSYMTLYHTGEKYIDYEDGGDGTLTLPPYFLSAARNPAYALMFPRVMFHAM